MREQEQIDRALELGVPKSVIQQWFHGDLIQDAMPWLSVDDREYILTGITADQWESMFGGED